MQTPSANDTTALRELAERTALEAGAYLRDRIGNAGRIDRKGAIDLVTEADRGAEKIIVDAIRAARPADAILAEEGGASGPQSSGVRWVIDPLDGTTNFAHAFPMFAVSIGVEVEGNVVAGAVGVPMLDELFVAERGEGAWLVQPSTGHRERIRVSDTPELERAFLATGFPYDIRTNPDNNLDHFANFATRCLAIRRAGAAALDLAYMACGRFDGFWELRLKPWDVAAGIVLIEEAGGTVTMTDGTPVRLDSPAICASNSAIHHAMLDVLGMR